MRVCVCVFVCAQVCVRVYVASYNNMFGSYSTEVYKG